MIVDIKLGSREELSGGVARAFEVIAQPGNYRDDEVYKLGVEVENHLRNERLRNDIGFQASIAEGSD